MASYSVKKERNGTYTTRVRVKRDNGVWGKPPACASSETTGCGGPTPGESSRNWPRRTAIGLRN